MHQIYMESRLWAMKKRGIAQYQAKPKDTTISKIWHVTKKMTNKIAAPHYFTASRANQYLEWYTAISKQVQPKGNMKFRSRGHNHHWDQISLCSTPKSRQDVKSSSPIDYLSHHKASRLDESQNRKTKTKDKSHSPTQNEIATLIRPIAKKMTHGYSS